MPCNRNTTTGRRLVLRSGRDRMMRGATGSPLASLFYTTVRRDITCDSLKAVATVDFGELLGGGAF